MIGIDSKGVKMESMSFDPPTHALFLLLEVTLVRCSIS